MSSKYVRDSFRTSWATSVPTIPFHETINDDIDHDTAEDLWATFTFIAFNEERVSMSTPACYEESGTITVSLIAKSGTGDAALLTAAELVRDAYRYWTVANLRIVQADPPLSDQGYSDGIWYFLDVDLSYVYNHYV